jgi:hypothetical protein
MEKQVVETRFAKLTDQPLWVRILGYAGIAVVIYFAVILILLILAGVDIG